MLKNGGEIIDHINTYIKHCAKRHLNDHTQSYNPCNSIDALKTRRGGVFITSNTLAAIVEGTKIISVFHPSKNDQADLANLNGTF